MTPSAHTLRWGIGCDVFGVLLLRACNAETGGRAHRGSRRIEHIVAIRVVVQLLPQGELGGWVKEGGNVCHGGDCPKNLCFARNQDLCITITRYLADNVNQLSNFRKKINNKKCCIILKIKGD